MCVLLISIRKQSAICGLSYCSFLPVSTSTISRLCWLDLLLFSFSFVSLSALRNAGFVADATSDDSEKLWTMWVGTRWHDMSVSNCPRVKWVLAGLWAEMVRAAALGRTRDRLPYVHKYMFSCMYVCRYAYVFVHKSIMSYLNRVYSMDCFCWFQFQCTAYTTYICI